MNIYTIHDGAAEFYTPPFFAKTDNEASRMFIVSLGETFPHRSDYALFRIGSFDQDTAEIVPRAPKLVLAGLSIDKKFQPSNLETSS